MPRLTVSIEDYNALRQKLNNTEKRRAYAWGKLFQQYQEHHAELLNIQNLTKGISEQSNAIDDMPIHLINEIEMLNNRLKIKTQCPVCLETIEEGKLSISKCGHKYCKECIAHMKNGNMKCAICRRNL